MRRWLFLLAPSLCCHRISHLFRTVIPASFVQPWIIIVELITYLELAYVPSALDVHTILYFSGIENAQAT